MGFWGSLGKTLLQGAGAAAAPFTGGASLAATLAAGGIGAGTSIAGSLLNRRAGANTTGNTSSTQNTSSTNAFNYDPQSLDTYHNLQGPAASNLTDMMADPWHAGYFQNALTRSYEQAGTRAHTLQDQLLNPAFGADVGNPSAFLASQSRRIAMGASREKADSLTNLLLGSAALRQNATNQALGYKPLQLGSTSTGTSTGTETSQRNDTQGSFWGDLLQMAGPVISGLGSPLSTRKPPLNTSILSRTNGNGMPVLPY